MANNRKIFLHIDDQDIADFNNYQSSHPNWRLSDAGLQIAYLLEKHLGNTKKHLDDTLVGKLEKLTDECNDFDIKIREKGDFLFGFAEGNLLNLAIRQVNTRIEVEANNITQFRILHLIKKMYLKSSIETQNKHALLYVPESLSILAINNNDLNLMSGIMPLMFKFDRDKIFKWSLLFGNIAIANIIVDLDNKDGRMKHQRWLEKYGAWPLIGSIKNESNKKYDNEIVNSGSDNYHLISLAQSIAQNFPMDEEASEFTLLFPFSNEYNYKKVLDKISIINKLEQINVIEAETKNKIGVCLLFGESHFLSLLNVIRQRAKIVILADVVRKQWMQIEHMLVCFDKSETPEDFIASYLENNPILNERVGAEGLNCRADLEYLKRHIKSGGSLGNYNFLSTSEKFKECKQAAKELIFVQIKLDLMDELKCQQLNALLSSYNATMTWCNLTNIHDYDSEHKLSKSVASLLQSSPNCLVMYSTETENSYSYTYNLSTHASRGLDKYFQACLNAKPFGLLKSGLLNSNDKLCDENNETSTLSKSGNDPMLGIGLFSPKTTSIKLISSKNNNDKQVNQRKLVF